LIKLEALTPEAAAIAPALCAALEGTSFVLAGGTGLALQLGHRVSVDFDWFCRPEAFPSAMRDRLAALREPMTVIEESAHTFECLLAGVKCSFFEYRPVFHAATETLHGRPLAPVEDIGVMKLVAISQRGEKRDFFDLYEILKSHDLRSIARRAREMLSETPVNAVHVAKSLAWFEDAEPDPDPIVLSGDGWPAVKAYFADRAHEHADILIEELETS
jgi:hypothetical protein